MKQYCRYCAFCFEADDYRCSNHPLGEQPHWTEDDIKQENSCPNYAQTDDIITGQPYDEEKLTDKFVRRNEQ